MQHMKVSFLWLNSYRCHTHRAVCQAVKVFLQLQEVGWSLYVWILLMCCQKLRAMCIVVLGMKELSNLLQRFWVGRTGPILWPKRWCEFTLLDNVFWDYVTELIYICPFSILLMERHTEIEHVLGPALFWYCTQHKVVIPLHSFGITNWSRLEGSRCPRRTCLDSRQPAHT